MSSQPAPRNADPRDPDYAFRRAGQDLTFQLLHGMADLDAYRAADQVRRAARPTLEWALMFMCQSYFASVDAATGGDTDETCQVIRRFVQDCQALRDAQDAVDDAFHPNAPDPREDVQ